MADHDVPAAPHKDSTGVPHHTLSILEKLDNFAHIIVAIFFILMSVSVLIHTSLLIVRQAPLITEALHRPLESEQPVAKKIEASKETTAGGPGTVKTGVVAEASSGEQTKPEPSPFLRSNLELLSNILFVVIILELLKTIITYLQTRNIHAIMKEFLVVGIISSIRKILLIGAESSLASVSGIEYIKEATGTVISIIGILLLIIGLVVLQRNGVGTSGPPQKI